MGYKFNPFTGNFDTTDSPNGVFDSVEVNGDINLDDGGTYATTLQLITPTANRTISFPDATGTVGLVGGSSGQLVYNNAGAYAGAPSTSVGASGDITLSLAGAASTPPVSLTGTWFSGGTSTTTKPQLLIEPVGTTSTAWSTDGTGLGVNAASGFTGRLFDFQVNGSSKAVLTGAGLFGIGTASPSQLLEVRGPVGATEYHVAVGDASLPRILVGYKPNGFSGTASSAGISVDNSGSVLIGTRSDVPNIIRFGTSTGTGAAGERVRIDSSGTFRVKGTGTGGVNDAVQLNGSAPPNSLLLDASGRLLVGTDSAFPAANITPQFQVGGTTDIAATALVFNNANTANPPQLLFGKARGGGGGTWVSVLNNDVIGRISFSGADNAGDINTTSARIECVAEKDFGINDSPGRLIFSTTADGASSPTERMRITQRGGVKIGTTSDTINSTNFGTVIGSNSIGSTDLGLFRTSRNQTAVQIVIQAFGVDGEFRTMGDGDAENTNNSYGGISDAKLKENIVDANSQWDDLKALQVRKYNFKAETGYRTHTQIGLVAQEVELVSPGLVGESIDEETGESTKSVNYSVLYMKAVKALQEAMERIETLEAKVAALESQ